MVPAGAGGKEEIGLAVDLVEHHQLVQVEGQVGFGVCQFGAVGIRFEIEVQPAELLYNLKRQRGLADLPRAKQTDCRSLAKVLEDGRGCRAFNHPCNYAMSILDLQGCSGAARLLPHRASAAKVQRANGARPTRRTERLKLGSFVPTARR
jgi:hypothetical protein